MAKFKDNKNLTWTVELTLGNLRKIRANYPLDIFNHDDWERLVSSLSERLAFLWLVLEEQAQAHEVDLDQFEANLLGIGYADAASDALFAAMASFFRTLGQQGTATMTEAQQTAIQKLRTTTSDERFRGALDNIIDQRMIKLPNVGQTSSPPPPSPASTGNRSPSENSTTQRTPA